MFHLPLVLSLATPQKSDSINLIMNRFAVYKNRFNYGVDTQFNCKFAESPYRTLFNFISILFLYFRRSISVSDAGRRHQFISQALSFRFIFSLTTHETVPMCACFFVENERFQWMKTADSENASPKHKERTQLVACYPLVFFFLLRTKMRTFSFKRTFNTLRIRTNFVVEICVVRGVSTGVWSMNRAQSWKCEGNFFPKKRK